MSTPQEITKQVHLDGMIRFHRHLVEALQKLGYTGAQLNEIFARHVRSTCILCGLELSGDDLSQLALAGAANALPNPKLARLRQGYCGRKDCTARYYQLHFSPEAAVDWAGLFQQMEAPSAPSGGPSTTDVETTGSALNAARRKSLIRLLVGLAIVLALLLCRHLMSGGSLPGLRPAHKYAVDPNSVEANGK